MLSCFMIAHLFKDKQKVVEDINYLNLIVSFMFFLHVSMFSHSHCNSLAFTVPIFLSQEHFSRDT